MWRCVSCGATGGGRDQSAPQATRHAVEHLDVCPSRDDLRYDPRWNVDADDGVLVVAWTTSDLVVPDPVYVGIRTDGSPVYVLRESPKPWGYSFTAKALKMLAR